MESKNNNCRKIIMKIVIIEDEPLIAREIADYTSEILKDNLKLCKIFYTYEEASEYLATETIDLCLLDLNLNGVSGFEILKNTLVKSFHTIIISARTEQALEAFKYGVLDFIPKPLTRERLREGFDRFNSRVAVGKNEIQHLVVRKHNSNHMISISEILYFEAKDSLVKMHLRGGKHEFIEKSLNRLNQILPGKYIRTHRSYIVNINEIVQYRHKGGGVYELELKTNEKLPLSPTAYKTLQKMADKK